MPHLAYKFTHSNIQSLNLHECPRYIIKTSSKNIHVFFFFSPCYSPKLSSSPNLRKEEYVSGSLELLCKTLPRWQMALWSSSSYVAAMEKQAWGPNLCNEGSGTENSRSLGPWGHCRSAQEVMNWTDRPLYVFWVVIHVSFLNPQKQRKKKTAQGFMCPAKRHNGERVPGCNTWKWLSIFTLSNSLSGSYDIELP